MHIFCNAPGPDAYNAIKIHSIYDDSINFGACLDLCIYEKLQSKFRYEF